MLKQARTTTVIIAGDAAAFLALTAFIFTIVVSASQAVPL